jgi:hypothetical protein
MKSRSTFSFPLTNVPLELRAWFINIDLHTNSDILRTSVVKDRLCDLLVRVPGYRSRGPGFDSPALPDFLRSSGSGTGST